MRTKARFAAFNYFGNYVETAFKLDGNDVKQSNLKPFERHRIGEKATIFIVQRFLCSHMF